MDYSAIKKQVQSIYPTIVQMRRQIHRNPELSFKEFQTAEFIRTELDKMGIHNKPIAETGTVALIGSGEKCVALRADIDALPITESSGLDYSSANQGIMHACGHDMHTAMLLGAAEILNQYSNQLGGCIKLIFQPAEEKLPGGAKILIEEGVLENPRPAIIFGQHVDPAEACGTISVSPGTVMASADELYWTINGKGTHAAQPHIGSDTILAAANIATQLTNLSVKRRNPIVNGLLTVTSIQGGNATNIIPNEVKLLGTLRSFEQDWREQFHKVIIEKSQEIASIYDCTCDTEIIKGYPPLTNDSHAANMVSDIALNLFGNTFVREFEAKMWAEDFAYYSQVIPACFWFLGVKPIGLTEMPSLHNPAFAPDEEALIHGTAMLISTAISFLNKP